jgi:hypothetical protein
MTFRKCRYWEINLAPKTKGRRIHEQSVGILRNLKDHS